MKLSYLLLWIYLCSGASMAYSQLQIHGHRGARGHLPENTLPSFIKAVELGASWLECDLVVSADSQLVVSHEPWFNPDICVGPAGNPLPADHKTRYNIYQMPAAELRNFDCGARGHPKFPSQQPLAVAKPTFKAFVMAVDSFTKATGRPLVNHTVEIKSDPNWDGTFAPEIPAYAQLILKEIEELEIKNRCFVQAFDARILIELHRLDTSLKLGFLNEFPGRLEHVIAKLGFTPYAYNPNHIYVSKKLLRKAAEADVKIIPWTVNEPKRMKKLIEMGVDGIITDYPDRAAAVARAAQR